MCSSLHVVVSLFSFFVLALINRHLLPPTQSNFPCFKRHSLFSGVAEEDKSGDTPFNLCMFKNDNVSGKSVEFSHTEWDDSRSDVFSALFGANSSVAAVKDNKGRLPIHNAVEHNVPQFVIDALLGAYPSG